jgi:hypothetical protein
MLRASLGATVRALLLDFLAPCKKMDDCETVEVRPGHPQELRQGGQPPLDRALGLPEGQPTDIGRASILLGQCPSAGRAGK